MAGLPRKKKPAIPQCKRVKLAAEILRNCYNLLLEKEKETSKKREDNWEEYMHAVEKLVRLDNRFLQHPLIQNLLPHLHKEELRKLHRGLEKGTPKPLGKEESEIYEALVSERDKGGAGWVERARKQLVNLKKIKKVSRQAFHKRALRILASIRVYEPFNRSAIPSGVIPDYIKKALPYPQDDSQDGPGGSIREALEIEKLARRILSFLLLEPAGWMYRRDLQQAVAKKGITGKEFAEALQHLEETGRVKIDKERAMSGQTRLIVRLA